MSGVEESLRPDGVPHGVLPELSEAAELSEEPPESLGDPDLSEDQESSDTLPQAESSEPPQPELSQELELSEPLQAELPDRYRSFPASRGFDR